VLGVPRERIASQGVRIAIDEQDDLRGIAAPWSRTSPPGMPRPASCLSRWGPRHERFPSTSVGFTLGEPVATRFGMAVRLRRDF
jgi:hypothetical protein